MRTRKNRTTTTGLRIRVITSGSLIRSPKWRRLQFRCPNLANRTPDELVPLKPFAEWLLGTGVQHFERMCPRSRKDAVEYPGHAHRLEVAGAVDAADVDHAPAEVSADLRDGLFRVRVVAAQEHVRRSAGQLRLVEERVAG